MTTPLSPLLRNRTEFHLSHPRLCGSVLALLGAVCCASPAGAQTPPAGTTTAPAAATPKPKWTTWGSLRLRQELWNWFDTPGMQDRYTFTASTLRLGASRQSARDTFLLEAQATGLINLPHHASGLPPVGQLGHGASYFDANAGQDLSLFLKQAYWKGDHLGAAGNSLRVGRFEFSDGAETVPKDPSLAWLKQQRISQRLIGPFAFTHVGRSFDGLEFTRRTPRTTLDFLGAIPTRGVFDLNGMDTLPDVRIGYLSATRPFDRERFHADTRLFGIYYDDVRDQTVKTDNRALPDRLTDTEAIRIGTLGGHALAAWELPAGKLDALLWGGAQFGKWGRQDHQAFAFAVEGGYQPRGVWGKPWFRVGFNRYSGDSNPTDGKHATWMPLLPTPRPYARFPFFTEMNLNDAFGQVVLKPTPKLTLRPEIHFLSLAEDADLWYAGGGAFQDRPSFGYAGRPSGGKGYLGTLADISVDYQFRKDTSATLYFGHVRGGGAVTSNFSGRNAWFGYLELNRRF